MKVYRADIDGLRAIAVIAVVMFHGFPTAFHAGFVGVDIFFVISGYLITGILLRNLDEGGLRLFDFYRHRVRRIFPALIVVLAACLAVGSTVLLADEFANLTKQISYSVVFASNFALWWEAGYFDVASEIKPLLHLWSLAVEEQFYLFWPLLLWVGWKFRLSPIWLAAFCLALSFEACVLVAPYSPIADFFSPFTRIWEILVGAMLIGAERARTTHLGIVVRSALSTVGAILVCASLLLLDQSSPYPGWRAAVPVIGSSLVIAGGPLAFINRNVLASRPLVAIGLISYPLYLWHWPLLVFARILMGVGPPIEIRAGLLIVAVVLAALTYAVIERPLRFGAHATAKMVLLSVLMIITGGSALYAWQNGGLQFRYIVKHAPPSGIAALDRSNSNITNCDFHAAPSVGGWCYTDTREPPRFALLGDSHGEALFWGLARNSKPNGRWLILARPACAPMVEMQRLTVNNVPEHSAEDPAECAAFNASALDFVLRTPSIHTVLIVVARRVLEKDNYARRPGESPVVDGAFMGLSALVTELQQSGKSVAFLEDNPYVANSEDCVPRSTGFRLIDAFLVRIRGTSCSLNYASYRASIKPYLSHIATLEAEHPGLLVFDSASALCDVSNNSCPMLRDGKFLYSYGDHISTYGGDLIASALQPAIDNLTSIEGTTDQSSSTTTLEK